MVNKLTMTVVILYQHTWLTNWLWQSLFYISTLGKQIDHDSHYFTSTHLVNKLTMTVIILYQHTSVNKLTMRVIILYQHTWQTNWPWQSLFNISTLGKKIDHDNHYFISAHIANKLTMTVIILYHHTW